MKAYCKVLSWDWAKNINSLCNNNPVFFIYILSVHHQLVLLLKGQFTQKRKFCHHLFSLCCSKPVSIFFFCWTQKKIFWRRLITKQFWLPLTSIVFFCSYNEQKHPMLFLGFAPQCSSKYCLLCCTEKKVVQVSIIWGWINDVRIHNFVWTVYLF